jgi:gluconate 5-dehydrogenase
VKEALSMSKGETIAKKEVSMSILEKFGLNGKAGIVTGVSSGLGFAFAEGLAEAGADLLIAARRMDRLEEVAEKISKSTGRKIIPLKVDVTSEEDIKNMVRRADAAFGRIDVRADAAFGRIDVIVNNAGVAVMKPAVQVELEEWNKVIDVNLTGVFLCAREAAKYMIEKGIKGSIINIASGYGELADTTPASSYYASKAGVINLTRGLANEWGHFGIRVNSLCPGWFPTEMTQGFFDNKEWVSHMSSKIALGRLGKLDDMKPLIIFMASDASEYISGHAFEMLGGPVATAETIDTGLKYLKEALGEEYVKPFKFIT